MSDQDMQKTLKAADLISQLLRKVVVLEQGIHAETIISAASRMAGTMLFRSFGLDDSKLEPGSVLMSEQADQQGPGLVDAVFEVLKQLGHDGIDAAALDAAADKPAPPRLSLAENQSTLNPWYRKIMETSELSNREMALASAIATATLIHDCESVLDVPAGCLVAINGIVEGTKTVPQPFAEAVA